MFGIAAKKPPTFTPKFAPHKQASVPKAVEKILNVTDVQEPSMDVVELERPVQSTATVVTKVQPIVKIPVVKTTASKGIAVPVTTTSVKIRDSTILDAPPQKKVIQADFTDSDEDEDLLMYNILKPTRPPRARKTKAAPVDEEDEEGSIIVVKESKRPYLKKKDREAAAAAAAAIAGGDSVENAVSSSSAARKRTKTETKNKEQRLADKATAKYSVFPASLGPQNETTFQRITAYFRKTSEGIAGLEFTKVDGKPVLTRVDRELHPETATQNIFHEGDVLLSVNSLDARYTSFERIMAELLFINRSAPQEGESRVSIRNSMVDALAVVVFARPSPVAAVAVPGLLRSKLAKKK